MNKLSVCVRITKDVSDAEAAKQFYSGVKTALDSFDDCVLACTTREQHDSLVKPKVQ